MPIEIAPPDTHNKLLVDRVHPSDWTNPTPAERYNLVVIGGGTAGLVAAHGAAGLGARVAIVERRMLGGDCLVTGCVPSKALISSAHVAATARDAALHGVNVGPATVDFGAVMARMRKLRAGIAHEDSALRLQEAGVDVFLGSATFTGRDCVQVEGEHGSATLRFAKAAIATGARAVFPPIPGIEDAPVVTHEGLFELTELPPRLLVIGAGPIGCELAQALARLGSQVTLIDMQERVLPIEEPDASAAVEASLVRDGVRFISKARLVRFEEGPQAVLADDTVLGFDLALMSVGRRPNIEHLGLEAAGVEADRKGITVDPLLCTTNSDIFASGDCASRFQFTHAADALSRVLITNALFFGRRKHSALVIPWATYTDPEVAHVGITWEDAAKRDDLTEITKALDTNDRSILEGETVGYCRAWVEKDGTIAGATVVGRHAGELIAPMALAMQSGLSMKDLGAAIFPYPTRAYALHRLGDLYNRTRVTPTAGKALDVLMKLRR